MDKYKIIGGLYRNILRPVAFGTDAEAVHIFFTGLGEKLEVGEGIVEGILAYKNLKLKKKVLGVEYENPVGLAAGFDWDGHLAQIMKSVGFGFNTVGTVTAKAYGGNSKPRLGRLPNSHSLLVNKGFMSEGAENVAKRLDKKKLDGRVMGISVGSSNLSEVNTINKAIDDYLFTFEVFRNKSYVKYWELNIPCPNTAMTESFGEVRHFKSLVGAVKDLHLRQPVWVKMANEIETEKEIDMIQTALKNDIRGFIFSNLVKDRNNPGLDRVDLAKFENAKGNFSGKPTKDNALKLVKVARKKFGKEIAIIGCGGIFGVEDAMEYLAAGANLVQLITGMIYEGPQLPGEICKKLIVES